MAWGIPPSAAPVERVSQAVLGPDGKPARVPLSDRCPRCGAGPEARVSSAGFGQPHEICRACAYEWESQP